MKAAECNLGRGEKFCWRFYESVVVSIDAHIKGKANTKKTDDRARGFSRLVNNDFYDVCM